MANATEIRHHIRAVEQTRKVTNAMHLVSSARMRQVMNRLDYNHRYFWRVTATMRNILAHSKGVSHPYLTEREGDKPVYIVLSGDKGMTGGYNNSLLNYALNIVCAHPDAQVITVGVVAGLFFRKNGITPIVEIGGNTHQPELQTARHLALDILDLFNNGVVNEAYVIFTPNQGHGGIGPAMRRLLPIKQEDYALTEDDELEDDILYEPSPQQVLNRLVPQYIIGILFSALMQAYASEHFARMTAMENATRNADEMLKKLQTQYNIARQAAITQEIAEITGAAEVLMDERD